MWDILIIHNGIVSCCKCIWLGFLTASRIVKNVLDELTIGSVKRSRMKWERHIVTIREMINVHNTFLAIKEARVYFQDPDENGRTVFRYITKQIPLSWFQTFALFWMLYAFFWVIPRRLNFIFRRFGTLCLFHPLHKDGTDRVFRKFDI